MALFILVDPATNVVDAAQKAPAGQTPSVAGLVTYEITDPDLWNELNGRIRSVTEDGRVALRPVTLTPPDPPRDLVRGDFAFAAVRSIDPRRRVKIEVAGSPTGPWQDPPAVLRIQRGATRYARLVAVNGAGAVATGFSQTVNFLFGANDRPPRPYRLTFASGVSSALEIDTSETRDMIFDGSSDVTVFGGPFRVRVYEASRLS